jgi:hypothetical protein
METTASLVLVLHRSSAETAPLSGKVVSVIEEPPKFGGLS